MILTSLEELLEFKSEEPLNLYTGERGFFLLQKHLQPGVNTFPIDNSEQKLVINNITVHYTDIIDHIAADDPKFPHPNGGFLEQYWYVDELDVFLKKRWPVAFDEVLEKENFFDTKELSNFLLEKYILLERKIV